MFFHDWMSEPGNETSNEWLASSQEPPASWINLSLSNGKGKKCVREALQKFGEELLSIMLKNNSLIKITGNMLDHNGKPVSFLQDFFFNASVHYYIITYVGQCMCHFQNSFENREPPLFLTVYWWEWAGSCHWNKISVVSLLFHFPWQLLGDRRSFQHLLHSWMKAERAAPV